MKGLKDDLAMGYFLIKDPHKEDVGEKCVSWFLEEVISFWFIMTAF